MTTKNELTEQQNKISLDRLFFDWTQSNKQIRERLRTREQAAKVAWRILKDWIEAQLAIVDAEMAQITEVFLPYAQNDSGETLYQSLESNGFNRLTHQP